MLNVFVGSTFRDLKDERKDLLKNLDEALTGVGMERFIPDGRASQEVGIGNLRDSDIVIFLISPYYGSFIEKCKIKDLVSTLLRFLNLTKSAYAGSHQFRWHNHKKNLRFKEKYTDKNTVRRYYDDGWVLEYQLDEKGISIPSSFKWIKKR